MDSWLIKELWKPDYCFYVNVASHYSCNEMDHLKSLDSSSRPKLVRGIELRRFERSDFIIPYRNVYLILAALNEYERLNPMEKQKTKHQVVEICLGATEGDRVLDKSPEFAENLSRLLTQLSRPQHWTGGNSREIRVVLPFKSWTKRDLLREYASQGSTPAEKQALLHSAWSNSFSCYTPDENGEPCGACKPCFRKTVAFTLEGYRNNEYIEKAHDYILRSGIWDQIQAGTYGRAEEESDIKEFMDGYSRGF